MQSQRTKIYHSYSSDETKALGREFARAVVASATASRRKGAKGGACVVALEGNLGAGKTTFVQGFFEGLGLKRHAMSPTFVIMRRHALARRSASKNRGHQNAPHHFTNVFHIDAYRLKKTADLTALGMQEVFGDPHNIVLIEWPERAKGILPKNILRLKFLHGKKEHERKIVLVPTVVEMLSRRALKLF